MYVFKYAKVDCEQNYKITEKKLNFTIDIKSARRPNFFLDIL